MSPRIWAPPTRQTVTCMRIAGDFVEMQILTQRDSTGSKFLISAKLPGDVGAGGLPATLQRAAEVGSDVQGGGRGEAAVWWLCGGIFWGGSSTSSLLQAPLVPLCPSELSLEISVNVFVPTIVRGELAEHQNTSFLSCSREPSPILQLLPNMPVARKVEQVDCGDSRGAALLTAAGLAHGAWG